MKPITFQCHKLIPRTGEEICAAIANVDAWSQFAGYGFLPGIENAVYENRTEDMIGSRIRVRNTDGSGHVEEIYHWIPGQEVAMKLHEFTPPLSRLASHFTEEWRLKTVSQGTIVTRSFAMYPVRPLTRPFVWLISLLFRRAINRHLVEMAGM
jgi:hypothetical protein